jgi:hypothetical protein
MSTFIGNNVVRRENRARDERDLLLVCGSSPNPNRRMPPTTFRVIALSFCCFLNIFLFY